MRAGHAASARARRSEPADRELDGPRAPPHPPMPPRGAFFNRDRLPSADLRSRAVVLIFTDLGNVTTKKRKPMMTPRACRPNAGARGGQARMAGYARARARAARYASRDVAVAGRTLMKRPEDKPSIAAPRGRAQRGRSMSAWATGARSPSGVRSQPAGLAKLVWSSAHGQARMALTSASGCDHDSASVEHKLGHLAELAGNGCHRLHRLRSAVRVRIRRLHT